MKNVGRWGLAYTCMCIFAPTLSLSIYIYMQLQRYVCLYMYWCIYACVHISSCAIIKDSGVLPLSFLNVEMVQKKRPVASRAYYSAARVLQLNQPFTGTGRPGQTNPTPTAPSHAQNPELALLAKLHTAVSQLGISLLILCTHQGLH